MALFRKLLKKENYNFSKDQLPRHIAIIMDGNGRWAKKRGLPRQAGHAVGSETFRRVATICNNIGIDYLTVFAFSTENWKRPQQEVSAIMDLLRKYLAEALEKMEADRVKLCFFGDLSVLPEDIKKLTEQAREKSRSFGGLQVNICINYGGRMEILRAARNLAESCMQGRMKPEDIDEKAFSDSLYSAGIPDPDLVIRPSGEQRISNFLLWQSAYAEYYFTDVLWPDFDQVELMRAIHSYTMRSRRFGGVQ